MPIHCASCGYDVTAILDASRRICPECGRPIAPGRLIDFTPRPWWWYAAALPLTLAPAALMILPIFLRRAADDHTRILAPYLALVALGAALPYLGWWTRAALRAHGLPVRGPRAAYLTAGLFLYNLSLAALAWLIWAT